MDKIDKKILEGLLDYCIKNDIRILQSYEDLLVEIGSGDKYRLYVGEDLEISKNTKMSDFKKTEN